MLPLLFILFYKKAKESAIKVKHISVHLEITNHIPNSINRNISEEENVKSHKSFIVAQWRGQGGVGVIRSNSSARWMDRV